MASGNGVWYSGREMELATVHHDAPSTEEEQSPESSTHNEFSIYCQSVFLDIEIYPLYCLIDCDVTPMIGKFQFRIKDSTSAYLRVIGTTGTINLTLDVQTQVTSVTDLESPNIFRGFIFTRFGERYRVNVLHYAQIIDEILENEFATFGFFLQQFCRFYEAHHNYDEAPHIESKRQVNMVARGAESTGFVLRQGLKGGGKSAGDVIRYFGQPSKANSRPISDPEATSLLHDDQPHKTLTEEEIAAEEKRAEYIKQQAELIHSYAKTATSALMLPIRMIGRKAVEFAQPSREEEQGWKKSVMDTVGGCGNGIMSVAKGFTEGLQEMGQAIEEVAMQRAIEKYGPEYAERVTRKYLSAGSEGCRAAIKTVSVASMGFHGFVAGMAVEGVDYAVNLKDYLVGPVILQNYLLVLQYPLTSSVRYFTVLRPWCLAFYYHHSEFATKPHKIMATANLDTIPKLREERVRDPLSGEYVTVNYIEIATVDGSTYALRLDSSDHNSLSQTRDSVNWFNSNDIAPSEYGVPSNTSGSSVILEWFRQIQEGSRRMETVRKHQSGATELREERWLKRCPRGIGWKWNGDVPEVVTGDFEFLFTLHGLFLSTEQLREAMEFEPNKLVEAERIEEDDAIVEAVVSPNSETYPFGEEELEVSTPEEDAMVSSLVEMIGVSREEAQLLLQRVDWDINRALDEQDLLGLSDTEGRGLPTSPPDYHTVVAVPIDSEVPSKKSSSSFTPSVKSTAQAVKRNVKADISSVNVSLRLVTVSGLRLKIRSVDWVNLTLPSDESLLAGRGSYRQAVWTPPALMEIGNEMRIHRDTCAGIELVVTAHTKMGIRYKVGVCSLDIETLVYDNASLGAILLPIYRMKKGPLHDSTFAIGEMNLQIQKRPYSAPLPPNPPPYHTLQQIE